MAKILMIAPPFWGHIFPLIALSKDLKERGHEITFINLTRQKNERYPSYLKVIYPKQWMKLEEKLTELVTIQNEGAKITNNKVLRWSFESTWIPLFKLLKRDVKEVIESHDPDLVICDEGLLAISGICKKEGIPYITSITTLPGIHQSGRLLMKDDEEWLDQSMKALLDQLEITQPRGEVFNSMLLNIVFTSKEFSGLNEDLPSRYKFVGPSLTGRPSDKQPIVKNPNWPTIYVSAGSLLQSIKTKLYDKIVEAFGDKEYNILISANANMYDQWPSNFVPNAFWNQTEILPEVDLVITHGGFNTINESLYYDKPVIAIPFATDQYINGLKIEEMGCGVSLRHRRLSAGQLIQNVERILMDKHLKNNVSRIGSSLRESAQNQNAVKQIENCLQELNLDLAI